MPDMTHPKGVTAEVTQADREAAVDIHNVILHDWFTQHMLDGMEDECYVIQAFARHRLSSTAALEAEVERWHDAYCIAHDQAMSNGEAYQVAAAQIASLKQRLESAEGALDKFGKHDGLCARIGGYGYCNCGLEDALERHQAGLGKGDAA